MQILLRLNCYQRVWIINYVGKHHIIVTAKSQKLLSRKFLDSTISNIVSHLMWHCFCADSQLMIFFLCSFSVKTLINSYLYFVVTIIFRTPQTSTSTWKMHNIRAVSWSFIQDLAEDYGLGNSCSLSSEEASLKR